MTYYYVFRIFFYFIHLYDGLTKHNNIINLTYLHKATITNHNMEYLG